MKNEAVVIKIYQGKYPDVLDSFQKFREDNSLNKESLASSFAYLMRDYNRLLKFEADFKNDMVGVKLSSREAQKQGYLMLSVLNTFLYENEFGLSMPLFLNDQKSEMLRKVEFNYDQWIQALQIKSASKITKSQPPITSPGTQLTSDNKFGSLPNSPFN